MRALPRRPPVPLRPADAFTPATPLSGRRRTEVEATLAISCCRRLDPGPRAPTPWAHVPVFATQNAAELVVNGEWITLDRGRRYLRSRHWWPIVENHLAPAATPWNSLAGLPRNAYMLPGPASAPPVRAPALVPPHPVELSNACSVNARHWVDGWWIGTRSRAPHSAAAAGPTALLGDWSGLVAGTAPGPCRRVVTAG